MGLEEEIQKYWEELEEYRDDGNLERYRKILEGNAGCPSPEEVSEQARFIEETARQISKYFRIGEPPSQHEDAYLELKELDEALEEAADKKKRCIDNHLMEMEAEHRLDQIEPVARLKDLQHISNASHSLDYGKAIGEAQRLTEEIIGSSFPDTSNDRFINQELRERYDEEYHEIKQRFDEITPTGKKDLKKLKELAIESQHLTQKYKSISDEEGINHSARLHEDIEEAAERISPIYESWKLKRVSVGVILLAAGIGFWKGDYVKNQLIDYFGMGVEEVQERQGLPTRVMEAAGQGMSRVMTFDISDLEANLYDLEQRQTRTYPFTASLTKTPLGEYRIESYGHGINSPEEIGTVHLRLKDDFFISGTPHQELARGVEQKRYMTQGNIFLKEEDLMDIYRELTGKMEETLVIIER